jgi:hypothetical protein
VLSKFCATLLIISLSACISKPIEFMGTVYESDFKNDQIINSPEDHIKCTDQSFDKFVCMSQDDFQVLINELLKKRNQ